MRWSETAARSPAIASGEPATVPPVAVTLTVWPLPRSETVLPTLSVTPTLALTVPLLPSAVIVQVKRQGEPIAAGAGGDAGQRPARGGAGGDGEGERRRGRDRAVGGGDAGRLGLVQFHEAVFRGGDVATPAVKVSAVAVPKLIAVPAVLATVGSGAAGAGRGAGEGDVLGAGVGGGGVAVGVLGGGRQVVAGRRDRRRGRGGEDELRRGARRRPSRVTAVGVVIVPSVALTLVEPLL